MAAASGGVVDGRPVPAAQPAVAAQSAVQVSLLWGHASDSGCRPPAPLWLSWRPGPPLAGAIEPCCSTADRSWWRRVLHLVHRSGGSPKVWNVVVLSATLYPLDKGTGTQCTLHVG